MYMYNLTPSVQFGSVKPCKPCETLQKGHKPYLYTMQLHIKEVYLDLLQIQYQLHYVVHQVMD